MIKYNSYKSSGIEWLGKIPSHWENKKIKYIFKIKKQIAGTVGFDVLSITQQGIKIKDIESGGGQLSMDYSKYQLVKKGDFAMNHMDLLTGYVDISKYDGVTSPDYRVFYLTEKESAPKYFLYLMQMGYQNKIFYAQGQGSSQLGRWRFASEEFNNFFLPVPTKKEQEAIANFLDKKLEQVDNYISKQKELIELLKEKKSLLINQAVTKGLDPKVEYKESGIEWLGKIPKHWEVKKIKYFVNKNSSSLTADSIKNNSGNYKIYGASGYLQNINFYNENDEYIAIVKDGAGVGRTFICESKSSTLGTLDILRTNKYVILKFLLFVLKNINYDLYIHGSTIPHIYYKEYSNNKVALPPKKEQKQIVEYIEKESSKIDNMITTKEDEIKLLDEYKQSLISSAVTGKIKVS